MGRMISLVFAIFAVTACQTTKVGSGVPPVFKPGDYRAIDREFLGTCPGLELHGITVRTHDLEVFGMANFGISYHQYIFQSNEGLSSITSGNYINFANFSYTRDDKSLVVKNYVYHIDGVCEVRYAIPDVLN